MECPTSTTGTDPYSATTASSASFRSPTGEASAPFQPRTRKRWRWIATPLPRSASLIAPRDGDHPEHGGLQRGGRRGARRLAAVRDQDDTLGGYLWGYLPARHLPALPS